MEPQKTSNNQNNLKKEHQSWRNHDPWLQTILQSYSNQNSMVQAQKQTHKSMKQNKNPEINPHTYGQEARIHNGEKVVSSINGARKTSCV